MVFTGAETAWSNADVWPTLWLVVSIEYVVLGSWAYHSVLPLLVCTSMHHLCCFQLLRMQRHSVKEEYSFYFFH